MLPVNLYRFYIYLRDHFLRIFVSRAIISVLKELIHLIRRLQRKERRMLFLDYQDRRPIYEQIVEKFRMLILSGALEPSSKMPSVRQLAVELSINPNTIQKAYRELEAEGYVYTVAGKGTFVAERKEVLGVRNEELMKEFDEVVTELLFLATDGDSLKTRIEQLAKGGEAQ